MTVTRSSKNAKVYTLLDALDVYETWHVKQSDIAGGPSNVCNFFNNRRKTSAGRRMAYHKLDSGVLFVRVK